MPSRLLPIALLMLIVAPGCAQKANNADVEAAQRSEFVRASEQRLTELDARVDTLRSHLANADEATRTEINKGIDDLQIQRRQAQTKLDEVRRASAETWRKAKTELADMLDALDRKLDEARARLR